MATPTGAGRTYCRIAIVLLAGLAAYQHAGARDAGRDHADRQALFLSDFLQFVRWPEDAFKDADEDLRVQIIGRDPFDGSLDRLLAGKMVDQHQVVVTHVRTPALSPLPHVVFIADDEEPRIASVLAAYCRKPVLTISDIDRFASRGGVVGLVEGGIFELIEDDHLVHFTINRTALYEARLQIGAERLHLAYPLFAAVSACAAR